MNMQQSTVAKVKLKPHIAGVILVPFALVTVIYALRVTTGIPLADEWRWFNNLLIPLLKGDILFSRYLTGEYALLGHTHLPALGLLYLTCTRWSCSLVLFTYVGLTAMVLGGLLLGWQATRTASRSLSMSICGMAVLGGGYFCITNDFPWLLVVFEYVYSLVAICYLFAVDRYFHEKLTLPALLTLTVLALLCGDTVGLAAVILAIGFLLVGGIRERRSAQAGVAIAALCLALAAVAFAALGAGVPIGVHSRLETLAALIANPSVFLTSLMHAFAQPLLDRVVLESLVGSATLRVAQLILGGAGLLLTIVVMTKWWRQVTVKTTHIPLLFVCFGVLTWGLILTSRYLDGGPNLMDAQRYVRNLAFVYSGAGMAVVSLAPTRSNRLIAIGFAVLVVSCFTLATAYQYRSVPYVLEYFRNARSLLITNPKSQETGTVIGQCADGYCAPAVEYLNANGMDSFLRQ